MVTGGNATVFVMEMDRAVRFYTEVLAMELTSRFDDRLGDGRRRRLHNRAASQGQSIRAPGTHGATMIGLNVSESIDAVTQHLRSSEVEVVGDVMRSESGNFVLPRPGWQ